MDISFLNPEILLFYSFERDRHWERGAGLREIQVEFSIVFFSHYASTARDVNASYSASTIRIELRSKPSSKFAGDQQRWNNCVKHQLPNSSGSKIPTVSKQNFELKFK